MNPTKEELDYLERFNALSTPTRDEYSDYFEARASLAEGVELQSIDGVRDSVEEVECIRRLRLY